MCSAFCSLIKWAKKNKSAHTPHDDKTFGDNNTMNTNVGVREEKNPRPTKSIYEAR
jgi:hypothetical protein